MSSKPYAPRFKNYGDWLIWRSTGIFGEFRMPVCVDILVKEGTQEGWLRCLTPDDINRILARYKEHVNYWNIGIEIIRKELQELANALDSDHNFEEIANIFDSLRPKRIPQQ